jgi:hypothetical protein
MRLNYFLWLFILSFFTLSFSDNWHIETVDDDGDVGRSCSIAVDSKDHPHISYQCDYDEHLKYAYWGGNKWNKEIVDNDEYVAWGTSIAVDSKDRPHIAYDDYDNIAIKYAYFDGNNWQIIKVDNRGNIGQGVSMALDSKDHPYIVYYSEYEGILRYAYFDGQNWIKGIVDPTHLSGIDCSIAIDSYDLPHVSYGSFSGFQIKYAHYDGKNWNIEIIYKKEAAETSIALDSNDRPYIVYTSIEGLLCSHFNGNNWITEVVDKSGGGLGSDRAIAFDSLYHLSIVYMYGKSLKYAHFDGNEWNIDVVDSGFDVTFPSICIDSNDVTHVSYHNYNNTSLKYARNFSYPGIDLTSFTAKPNNNAITLNWSVTTDEEISGFNLYRRFVPSGVIHELPIQYPPVGAVHELPTTVGEDLSQRDPVLGDDNPCPNADTQWTKVNTSLITGTNPYSYTDRDIMPETTYEYKLEAVTNDKSETLGTTQVTSGEGTPSSFDIARIYPTPASSQINIDVTIPLQSDIDISIYDITGRRVSTVASGLYNSGEYTLTSDISGLINGVYIVRMTADGFSVSKNFVIAR